MPHHIIHKQKVILHVSDEGKSHLLQDKVSGMFSNGLVERIEQVLDEVAGDEVVRIDKLIIDMNIDSVQNFEKEFKEKLLSGLKKNLSVKVSKANLYGDATVIISRRTSIIDSLLYFLQHGTLPWYVSVKNIRDWENEILSHFTAGQWNHLFLALRRSTTMSVELERFVLQFSDVLLAEALRSVIPLTTVSWIALYNEILSFGGDAITRRKVRDQLWLAVFRLSLTSGAADAGDFNYRVLTLLLRSFDSANISKPGTATQWADHITNIKAKYTTHTDLEIPGDMPEPGAATETRQNDRKEQDEKSFYVQNSGVILLHPFLLMYFKELGLLTADNNFSDEEAQKRSILLLHYLATGLDEAPEYNITLQKVLCGLAPSETLPGQIDLTEQEITESDNLLRAVTEHWPPLRRTSVEGLRTTFLQREGKLSKHSGGWRLQIEQKTVDILLGQLPWGYSTIKLPWMIEMMVIEWYQ